MLGQSSPKKLGQNVQNAQLTNQSACMTPTHQKIGLQYPLPPKQCCWSWNVMIPTLIGGDGVCPSYLWRGLSEHCTNVLGWVLMVQIILSSIQRITITKCIRLKIHAYIHTNNHINIYSRYRSCHVIHILINKRLNVMHAQGLPFLQGLSEHCTNVLGWVLMVQILISHSGR